MPPKPINFDNIQGNIFGGFNKDFQDFFFLKVQDKTKARKWVKENSDELISTSTQVLRFNNAFKALLASGVEKPESIITAEWANIAFSFKGLQALGSVRPISVLLHRSSLPVWRVGRRMEVFSSFAGCNRTFLIFTSNLGTWRRQTG